MSLAGIFDKVTKLNPHSIRINLTIESGEEAGLVIETFAKAINGKEVKDPCSDYTRGHFTRGVE